MTDSKQTTRRLAEDLMRVLDGDMEVSEVLRNRERYGEAFEHCQHGLQHYLADEDLRTKDSSHRAMQEAAMERLIGLLLTDAPNEELAAETFLK
jgi:hypothetical protein